MARSHAVNAPVPIACGHCGAVSLMSVFGRADELEPIMVTGADGVRDPTPYSTGFTYELLKCDACDRPNLARYDYLEYESLPHASWHEDAIAATVVYPHAASGLDGVPPAIRHAWLQAVAVRDAGGNAFPVAVRHVVDLICTHKRAKGDDFAARLASLAQDKAFPHRAIGGPGPLEPLADAASLELSGDDGAVLEQMCLSLLGAFYHLPAVALKAAQLVEKYR